MSTPDASARARPSTTESPQRPKARRGWRGWAQIAFGVLAVGLLVWTVAANWSSFVSALASMNPLWVAAAGGLILGGLYINMLSWRSVVLALGSPIGFGPAARVFFTSQLAKYIPGGIWPIVASTRLGRAAGLSGALSAVSMSIALLIGVTVGAVYSVGALYLSPAVREHYWWAPIVLLVCGIVVLLPPVLNRLIALALRIVRHQQMPPLERRPFFSAILWSVLSWLLLGTALACLVVSLGEVQLTEIVLSVGSYAIAWVSGFVAVIAPAGAGVREVVLGLTLGTFVPVSAVLGIVVVDRILMTFGDVAMFLLTVRPRRYRAMTAPEARS